MMSKSMKIATQVETLAFFKQYYGLKHRNKRIFAFYSSTFNKIITDEHLMLIPIDERMATRSHAVFDVLYVKKLNAINLDEHVKRLIKSSESVSIKPPLSHDEIVKVVDDVMSSLITKLFEDGLKYEELLEQVFGVRLSISSGYGDFGIASIDKKPEFYMTVFEPYINYKKEYEGVNEFIVKIVKQPKQLVHTKTVNYVQSALMANESRIKGGYQGIKALQNGVLLEAAVANIAFMFDKQFATPRFETVIQGTTIKKLLNYVQTLKNQGIIEKISFRDILIQEAQSEATEMMVIGGDKIVPVLNFNGKPISEKRGKFTAMFQQWYEKEQQIGKPIKIKSKQPKQI